MSEHSAETGECRTCAELHPRHGCADVSCTHNCEAEVQRARPHLDCPVCGGSAVVVTQNSRWQKCRGCDASWNSEARTSPASPTPDAAA